MMIILKNSILALFCCALLISCGNNSGTSNSTEAIVDEVFPEDMYNSVDSTGKANLTDSQQALINYIRDADQATQLPEVMAPAALLALFPETVEDLAKFDEGGEISKSLGAPATLTRIIYRDGNHIARVNLIDTGGHPTILLGMAHWAVKALDRKEDKFTERTGTFRGFPAYEQWLPKSSQSKFEYVIDNRFVVSIQGKNLELAKVRRIGEFISPAQLRHAAKG